jgi:hypothetical protein
MELTEEILTSILIEKLDELSDYKKALEVVTLNAEGRIWLIGGIVSRVLIERLYETPQGNYDFDFLVENLKEELVVPTGWTVVRTKHGNPTFIKGDLEVDLFPIATHHFIKSRHLEPTIDNFFRGVPFTIQAIAFDVRTQKVIGKTGMIALEKREYRVNNLEEAQAMSSAKGITINERILKKAESMGLKPVLL